MVSYSVMDWGRLFCIRSPLPTPSAIPRIPLTPLFPLDRSHSPVSPLFPLDTKNEGGGGTPLPYMRSSARFAWFRVSSVQVFPRSVRYLPYGLRAISFVFCTLANPYRKEGGGGGVYSSQSSVVSFGEERSLARLRQGCGVARDD